MSKTEIAKRYILFVISLFFSALGVAFTKHVLCVLIALALSLIFFDFTIVGTREGTIISALLTGVVVKFFSSKLKDPLNAVLQG